MAEPTVLFMAGLFTLRAFARNLLRGSCRKNIFSHFIFDNRPGTRTKAFASNKPTHYILDHVTAGIENQSRTCISYIDVIANEYTTKSTTTTTTNKQTNKKWMAPMLLTLKGGFRGKNKN